MEWRRYESEGQDRVERTYPWPDSPHGETELSQVSVTYKCVLEISVREVWKWLSKNYIVAIVPTRSSAKVDLDLWPRNPKSIGFPLSSSTTYMWSLKVIGQTLYYCDCSRYRVHKVKHDGHTYAHARTHALTQPPTNGRVTISPPTLLQGDNNLFFQTEAKNWPQMSLKKRCL